MIFKKKLFNHFCGVVLGSALVLPVAGQAQQNPAASAAADSAVNSKYNEVKPWLSPDGKSLYFTRSNHPLNAGGRRDKGDVWVADVLPDGSWSGARVAGNAFNSSQLNMVIGFSGDGEDVYFQTYDPETKGKRQAGIYKMPVKGGNPKPVTIHYFFNGAKYQDASIAAGGKVMLLSMESYSTYGLEDLYVSFLQPDGSWSEPKNLGQDINTPKQEMSAWLSPDGETLFFASNGHGGAGSTDIFRSTRLDDSWKSWSKPVNMGPEVNSAGADIYYTEGSRGKWAFYSSTMNSEGYGDIRKIPVPERKEEPAIAKEEKPVLFGQAIPAPQQQQQQQQEVKRDTVESVTVLVKQSFDLQGKVLNENGAVQAAQVKISKAGESTFKEESATSGSFDVSLPEPGNYTVRVQAKGYHSKDTTLQVEEGVNELVFNLRPLRVGETVQLQNIMFRQSTAVLLDGSNAALDGVVDLMKENPDMEILLTGHTDNQGNSKANIKLSRERVEAVKNYLISRGIAEERIEGKGFGGTRPIASNANEESRKLNRRVEFTITKK